MTIQQIDRGTAGDPSDRFKIGTALDTAQANDEYLDSVKPTVIATFAALASTPVVAGSVYYLKEYLAGTGKGGGDLLAYAGADTPDNVKIFATATPGLLLERVNYNDTLTPFDGGASGVKATDEASMAAVIAALLPRGTMVIPAGIAFDAIVSYPILGNNESIIIIDERADRIDGVAQAFGVEEHYIEGSDSGGGLASELRVSGRQNPAVTLRPRSDGLATGYPYPNNMASFASFTNAGDNNFQILVDPYAHGRVGDWCIEHYAAGPFSVAFSLYAGIDLNNKQRFDFTPINLASASINISSITNTTPIVINTATPHGVVAQVSPVAISGTGNAALDGTSWIATNTGLSQVTLLDSVASGAVGAVGTLLVQKNAQRATVNVPKIQGGTEAIFAEGQIVAEAQLVSEVANGTEPVTVYSQTVSPTLHARPYVTNINGVQAVSGTPGSGGAKIVTGTAVLSGGTVTVTLTGDAIFTSLSTYKVCGSNLSAARDWQHTRISGSQIKFDGTGSDQIDFIAVGF